MRRKVLEFAVALASLLLPAGAASSAAGRTDAAPARCRGSGGFAEDFGGRRVFLLRPEALRANRAAVRAGEAADAYRALIAAAEAALGRGPYTVVDKRKLPASGNAHDYYSIGPYWWPDPDQPNGEPYVRHDGRINPERDTDAFDTADLDAMSADVETLALAYFYSGDRRYADHAARLLRTWFLDPATRMNPNLAHAQAIPGKVAGRKEGVIDAWRLLRLTDAVGLLHPSGALSPTDEAGLRDWFADLVEWMATSDLGRAERAKTNNHAIYYDLLASDFALFAGMDEVAKAIVARFPERRIAVQVAADGRLPEELERTRTFHYTNWTLDAAFKLAMLGECVGADLWHATTRNGRSLRTAFDFVHAYTGRLEDWPYPELAFEKGADSSEERVLFGTVLREVAWGWGDPALDAHASAYLDAGGWRGRLLTAPYPAGSM
jgi:hypothetical protein